MNFRIYKYFGALILGLVCSTNLLATHVIGGNVLYRCLGNDQWEITVEFAVDCALGDGEALALDSFATVKIFDAESNMLADLTTGNEFTVPVQDVLQLGDPNVACRVLSDPVCVQRQRYVQVVTLPYNENGYVIAFRRCCRNSTLLNVTEPLDTGATYWIELTPEAQQQCNTSARFKNWADVYLCANENLEFDASAIDIDGDSLVYKLCVPTEGGSDAVSLSSAEYFPPFDEVTFTQGYSIDNFLGAGTPLSIDSETGLITANAAMLGQFIVGICVEEYRDGVKISETTRDFEYNVRICTDPPTADFSVDVNPNCENLTLSFLNSSSSTQGNPLEYEWFFDFPDLAQTTEDENPSYTYSETGIYEVVLVTFDGVCQDTAFTTVAVSDGGPDLGPFLTDYQTSTCISTPVVLNPDGDPSLTYEWSSMPEVQFDVTNPSPTIFISESTVFTVTVTDVAGCTSEGMVTVDPGDGPPLPPLIDNYDAIQCAQTALLLNPNPISSYTYMWSASDPNVSFNPISPSPVVLISEPTTFTVTVTDVSGCTSIGSVNVTQQSGPPVNLINSLIQCEGDSVSLNPNFNENYVYQWESSPEGILVDAMDPNPTVSVEELTMFNLTITDPFNEACESTTFVNVLFAPNPELEVIPDSTVILCQGESQFFDVSTDGISIVWLDMNGDTVSTEEDLELTSDDIGDYTIVASTLFGCTTSYSLSIEEPDIEDIQITSLSGSEIYCEGETVTLYASTDSVNVNNLQWLDSNGNVIGIADSLVVFPSGDISYMVEGFSDDGCLLEGLFNLTESLLDAEITGPTSICQGETGTLSSNILAGSGVSFIWQPEESIVGPNNESSVEIMPQEINTVYSLTTTNTDGCEFTSLYTVTMLTVGPVAISINPDDIFFGQSTELSVSPELPGYSYEWSPSEVFDDQFSPTPTVTPTEAGVQTYSVLVTSPDGCVEEIIVTINVREVECRIENFYVPNMFTPNGDGHNDVFQVYTNAVDEFRLLVFDRWGETVFDTDISGSNGWDGTFGGVELAPDVYGYCVQVNCNEGEEFVKTGNITLVK